MFDTVVQNGVGIIIIAAIVYLLLRLLVFRPKSVKKDDGMTSLDFENEIYRINEHCTELSLKLFRGFLEKYQERNPRAFSQKEKGELRSLFYDVVVPESDVAIVTKEQFRKYLRGIGVDEMNIRPRYNQCIINHLDGNDAKDFYFENYGDIKVGDCLKKGLDPNQYYVIDGATFVDGDKKKVFPHIVVGDSGAFLVNTRDLGTKIHEEGIDPTVINIEKGDKWSIKKNNNEVRMVSPTSDMLDGKTFMENAMGDMLLEVHPVLVFPDEQLSVHQEEELPYKVIGTRNLCNYIKDYPSRMSISERTEVISRLNAMITE